MKSHTLSKINRNPKVKRIGRGIAAGGGNTAGRGTKGQKSRSGYNIPRKFEGGQTPLSMRLHKLPGRKSFKPKAREISLDTISWYYKDGETISMQTLQEKGMIKKGERAKILNSGELKVKIKIDGVPATKSVMKIVELNSKSLTKGRPASPASPSEAGRAGKLVRSEK